LHASNSNWTLPFVHLVLVTLIPVAVATLAWRGRALDPSGALAAALMGIVVLASSGWAGALVLAAFFVPTTLVGRWTVARAPRDERSGEVRSARQVVANGGAAMLGSLLEVRRPGWGIWVLTVSFAAASADTWATSLGRLSRVPPMLFGTGRRVPPGTSGGVSTWGIAGGAIGALLVAGTLIVTLGESKLAGLAFAIGWGGMFFDSALGASAQARFQCPRCATLTERRWHECGTRTTLESGWGWLDNDGVNLLTALSAALIGILVWDLR
jgi:uncharacterized protein (TIGR00297 family)